MSDIEIAALEGEKALLVEMIAYFRKPFWAHKPGTRFPFFAGECRPQARIQEIEHQLQNLL